MHLHATEYKFKHIYDMKTLKDYCDYAEMDIKRAEKVIKQVRKYQQELFDHVQNVLSTDMKKVVVLGRQLDYSSKKVSYYVQMENRPDVEHEHVDNQRVYGTYHDQQRFPGTERHAAIKYANELAKKYNCPLEKKGFPRR